MSGSRQPELRLSILPLGVGMVGLALLASAGTVAVSTGMGLASTGDAIRAGGLGFSGLLVGAVPALGIIRASARGGSRNFGMFVAAAGGLRMFLSLAIALVAYYVAHPESRTFWASFLAASLAALVFETLWAMNMAGRVCGEKARAQVGGMTGVVS